MKVLEQAVEDAERFISAAKKVLRQPTRPSDDWADGGENAAAMKRRSMDLTKSLTQVRRGHRWDDHAGS